MKLTDQGEYVFLELNPMGQYLYVEILAGLPLTAAMAELLVLGQGAVNVSHPTPDPSCSLRTRAAGDRLPPLSGAESTERLECGAR